mgnify:CR=1 FL=1|tara:strand:- start:63 stop:476 length:414 start_codon:yes stop_codon:yes gene_type:complete
MKTVTNSFISIDECHGMFLKAKKEADNQKIGIAFCVVDNSGILKYFARMDNAPLIAVDISRKKAITAVGFGMPTGEAWHNFVKDDPILHNGVSNITDFMLLGGGIPLIVDDTTVGAIGISGGHYKQDEACCAAAIKI